MADSIVVPSDFLAAIFQQNFKLDVDVLPNIADLEQFHFRQRSSYRPELIVARSLEPIYDHRTILKGFSIVLKKYPHATLRIAGAGSLRKELEHVSRELGLNRNVEFLGSLSPAQLSEVYAHSDIMVNASTIDNFPGALLEAFICGLPVVSSAAGGIPWMIQDRVNGLLFAVGDEKAMAEHVDFIISNPQAAHRFVAEANSFAQRHAWAEVRHKLFSLYGLS